MSLINDALKRAQQAQQENPAPPPPLVFRPVEADPPGPRRTPLLFVGLTLVIIAILGLSGLLLWLVSQSQQPPLQAAARIAAPPLAPAEPPAAAPAVAPEVSAPDTSEPGPALDTNRPPGSAVPAPPPLKVQGIFFNPQNPSAVVSDRTVYLGDRVNGFRVLGISPVAVTLASATETNVLSLSGH